MQPEGDEAPQPSLRSLMEWSIPRLLMEPLVGAAGGALLALALPGARVHLLLFLGIGGMAAPLALLLTPRRGDARYRAVRYGLALAVVVSLMASFAAGADALRWEELVGLGILVFGIGAGGHLCLAVSLDRKAGNRGPSGGSAGASGRGPGPPEP